MLTLLILVLKISLQDHNKQQQNIYFEAVQHTYIKIFFLICEYITWNKHKFL